MLDVKSVLVASIDAGVNVTDSRSLDSDGSGDLDAVVEQADGAGQRCRLRHAPASVVSICAAALGSAGTESAAARRIDRGAFPRWRERDSQRFGARNVDAVDRIADGAFSEERLDHGRWDVVSVADGAGREFLTVGSAVTVGIGRRVGGQRFRP
jgi:hypothetical protein